MEGIMRNSIKRLRNERGISQQKCADEIGISLRTFQRYENGETIGVGFYKKLAAYFGVSLDTLLSDDLEIEEKKGKK